MTNDIGNIVISKIETLPFIHKYAGVVRSLSYTDTVEGKQIKKTFPASAQITLEQCESGKYRDLYPDSSKKSVLYLEDMGARFLRNEGVLNYFNARYQLVCWLNLPLLGYASTEYSSIAMQGILSRFPTTPFNSGIYSRIKINVTTQLPKSINPFQKYTYNESVNQFLMYPFDYFVLELDVDFVVNKRCLEEQSLGEPIGCQVSDEFVLEYEVLHDYVSPYSYIGRAAFGSSETAYVWTITRIETLNNGTTITSTRTAQKWSERLIISYP